MSRVRTRLEQYKAEIEKRTQYKHGLPGSALDIVNTLLEDLNADEDRVLYDLEEYLFNNYGIDSDLGVDEIVKKRSGRMSHIKDRLSNYHDFMKKLADDHQMVLASDVLEMIEQIKDDLEQDEKENGWIPVKYHKISKKERAEESISN